MTRPDAPVDLTLKNGKGHRTRALLKASARGGYSRQGSSGARISITTGAYKTLIDVAQHGGHVREKWVASARSATTGSAGCSDLRRMRGSAEIT